MNRAQFAYIIAALPGALNILLELRGKRDLAHGYSPRYSSAAPATLKGFYIALVQPILDGLDGFFIGDSTAKGKPLFKLICLKNRLTAWVVVNPSSFSTV